MRAEQLLEDLTKPQREAVTHGDGPLLVLAGAGSGKTRVIARRAAYLAVTAVPARQVLAITFTNKAADEMRQRIVALGVGGGMTIATFHSFCARLLRQYAERVGVTANYSIFDQSDRVRAIKKAIGQCELASEDWKPSQVEGRISHAKNHMQSPEDLAGESVDFADKTICRIYAKYEQILTANNALDFDDLLVRMAVLLEQDKELRAQLEDRFRYVLIDEYQDTNRAQYLIARQLTEQRRNICATGDPDQSIYGWRGADLSNILEFEADYPDAKVVRLERNYRSTQRILSAAGELIQTNILRKDKALWTDNPQGSPVQVMTCDDEQGEARQIAERIARLRRQGRPLREVAIFYRVNAMTRVLEDALRAGGLPYQIARGVEFYNRKEIKDVLGYLRVMVNPADEIALVRIINTPARGIGKTTVERLGSYARQHDLPLMDAVRQAETLKQLGPARGRVATFGQLLDRLGKLVELKSVKDIVEKVLDFTGLEQAVLEREGPDSEQARNLAELISGATEYDVEHLDGSGSLVDWLAMVSLVNDIDKLDESLGAVSLMTLHAAKGLEFDVVFIAGLEEGLLPHVRSRDSHTELEEERRLCFVGMTRARKSLTLSHALYRSFRGSVLRTVRSPFLDELPSGQVDWVDYSEQGGSSRSARSRMPRWPIGQLMYHPEYGLGRLIRLGHVGGRPLARVQFNLYGEKSFTADESELKPVELDGDTDP